MLDFLVYFGCRYPYITFVLNFSQLWALYCLILFYRKTKKELHFINPLAKFLCFKAVVFVTWWQGVTIAFLFSSGLAFRWFSEKAIFRGHIQSGLQDLSICIEVSCDHLFQQFFHCWALDKFLKDASFLIYYIALLSGVVGALPR